jgi:hypothetical protein
VDIPRVNVELTSSVLCSGRVKTEGTREDLVPSAKGLRGGFDDVSSAPHADLFNVSAEALPPNRTHLDVHDQKNRVVEGLPNFAQVPPSTDARSSLRSNVRFIERRREKGSCVGNDRE